MLEFIISCKAVIEIATAARLLLQRMRLLEETKWGFCNKAWFLGRAGVERAGEGC